MEQRKGDEELAKLMQSSEQGSATTLWVAVGEVWEEKGGKYLSSCRVAEPAVVLPYLPNYKTLYICHICMSPCA
jgi:hypothetical protein